MTNVWQTRHRLSSELLQNLAEWLSSDDEPRAPAVLEEQTVRLLAVAVILLRQHQVNKRGQCRFCRWTTWTWRFWRRRRRCTVHQALDLAMYQNLDVVWWRVFDSIGKTMDLVKVRTWLTAKTAGTGSAVSGTDRYSDFE